MVDFKDPQSIAEITTPQGEGVEASSENHVLLDTVTHTAFHLVLRIAKTSHVEGEERCDVEILPFDRSS